MVDYQTISFYIGVFSVVFGVATWYFQSRRSQKITQASLFMQIHAQWRDKQFIENFSDMYKWEWIDLEDYVKKYMTDDMSVIMTGVIFYFEGVGELLKEGLIEIDIVYSMFGDRFLMRAEKFAPVLVGIRDYYEAPERYRNTEYLYEEMKKRQKIVRKLYQK